MRYKKDKPFYIQMFNSRYGQKKSVYDFKVKGTERNFTLFLT